MATGRTLRARPRSVDRAELQSLRARAFDERARPIACLGAGRMGRGIAVAFAYAGHDVTLVDFKPRDAEAFARLAAEALAEVRATLASLARFGLFDEDEVDASSHGSRWCAKRRRPPRSRPHP